MVRRHDGVRDSRYKLIHFYGEKNEHNDAISCNELYDLQSDPNELNNLYDNPEYADIQTRLQARLDKFRVDQKKPPHIFLTAHCVHSFLKRIL